mgnify:CR=1 FL=1
MKHYSFSLTNLYGVANCGCGNGEGRGDRWSRSKGVGMGDGIPICKRTGVVYGDGKGGGEGWGFHNITGHIKKVGNDGEGMGECKK